MALVLTEEQSMLRDSARGLISEIRAYYASPQDQSLTVLEIGGYDYAGLGYPVSAPPLGAESPNSPDERGDAS